MKCSWLYLLVWFMDQLHYPHRFIVPIAVIYEAFKFHIFFNYFIKAIHYNRIPLSKFYFFFVRLTFYKYPKWMGFSYSRESIIMSRALNLLAHGRCKPQCGDSLEHVSVLHPSPSHHCISAGGLPPCDSHCSSTSSPSCTS